MSTPATASAAQYEARAAVTAALLSSSQWGRPVSASPAPQPDYVLRTNNNEWLPVLGFTLTDGCLAADVGNNEQILAQNFEALIPTNSWH